MTVYEKLMHVQQNLKAPKNQYNTFGDYRYRSCEDIQEALKPVMAEVKAVLLICDEIVLIGSRYYIKATAIFQDVESSECITNTAYARESEERPKMDAAQVTASCSSYARKYALNGLFCIDDAKDPDASNTGGQDRKPVQGNTPAASRQNSGTKVNAVHIKTIRKEIERTGAQERAVCYQYKINRLEDMTMRQYKEAMDIFKQMPSAEPKEGWQQYQMTLEEMAKGEDRPPFR